MNRKWLQSMVPVTELANRASAIVQRAEAGETQLIVKRNRVVAVLMDVELLLEIKELSNTWRQDLDQGEWEDIVEYAENMLAAKRAAKQIPDQTSDLKSLLNRWGHQGGAEDAGN